VILCEIHYIIRIQFDSPEQVGFLHLIGNKLMYNGVFLSFLSDFISKKQIKCAKRINFVFDLNYSYAKSFGYCSCL
jgi:hypothetical protein